MACPFVLAVVSCLARHHNRVFFGGFPLNWMSFREGTVFAVSVFCMRTHDMGVVTFCALDVVCMARMDIEPVKSERSPVPLGSFPLLCTCFDNASYYTLS